MSVSSNQLLPNELDRCFRLRTLTMLEYLSPLPGERVLDCGSGRGFFLELLSEHYQIQAIGLDLDFDFLSVARHNSKFPLSLAQGSAEQLPFPDSTFDKIICSEVLEHLINDHSALLELHRVLKPGGTLALTVPNSRYPLLWDPTNWICERLFARPIRTGPFSGIWTNHQRLYKIEALASLLRSAHFEMTDTRHLTYFCFPFSHNLFYKLGPLLIERGLAGQNFDRYAFTSTPTQSITHKLLGALFKTIDTLNSVFPPRNSSVCIALRAIKAKQ